MLRLILWIIGVVIGDRLWYLTVDCVQISEIQKNKYIEMEVNDEGNNEEIIKNKLI